jgi:2-polyprenyl-3-methyl-5-hydroxy-6-metoxy-1,4-benzoquinol methylase
VSDAVTDALEDPHPGVDDPAARHLYLIKVMAEIDEEVLRRRSSGDLPPRIEHELDELFLRFSPMAGRDGSLEEALGVVEATSYIDPVVPLRSDKSGGTVAKKAIRKASLWYMSWVTAQMNQFATATSRTLRVLDDRVRTLQSQLDIGRAPGAPVLETAWAHGPDAWWAGLPLESLGSDPGRVLHAAAGDGWLVRRLAAAGVDVYGVEPREGRIDRAEVEGLDLREEPVLDHLRAVAPESLGGLILTGVLDAMTAAERDAVVRLAGQKVAPSGRLIIHSLSRAGWESDEAPIEADLASGRPLRSRTWVSLLGQVGFEVTVHEGPRGLDYLVIASADGGGGDIVTAT